MRMESSSALMYVGWEEVFVSNDKGRREIHYYLKRRDGRASDLAVIGKERRPRHISYRYVLRSSTNPSFSSSSSLYYSLPLFLKLRSRREVVDWLSSIVSDSRSHVSSQSVGGSLDHDDAFGADVQGCEDPRLRNLEQHSKEFLWLGSPWTCRKRRRHYQSFCRNGITISVHDFVYVLAEENKRLVAYLEDLYEDSRGNKMVVVRWFHKIDEVGIILPPNFNDREIFFSLCLQDLSVECIDGLATILSPQHFEKYLNEATHTLWEPFMCHRQFDNDDITAFDITQVQGYWKQEILRYMYTASTSRHLNSKLVDVSLEVGDKIIKINPKKKQRRSNSSELDMQIYEKKEVREATAACVETQKFSNGLVSNCEAEIQGLKEGNSPACFSRREMTNLTPNQHLAVDSHIEVLSQDSGIRGCWFRAVVIKRHKDKVKVRYQDIKDAEDEAKCLEEWILASRIAVPDELGLRFCGRTTVRPDPSSNKGRVLLDYVNVGTPVDGWWHDAWWEGIVVRKESEDRIHVYFPGERQVSIFGIGDLRLSQDWVSNRWTCIKGRPDLVHSILSGLETRQDGGGKSVDVGSHSVEVVVCDNRQPGNNAVVGSFSPKDEKTACNNSSCAMDLVPDLAKDGLLTQLKWNSSRKRKRHSREKLRRRQGLGSMQNSGGSSSSSSSRGEDLGSSHDSERFLLPNSLKVDLENWKYPTDSHLNVSIPPLTSLVMSM